MLAELKRRVCEANRRLPGLGLAPLNFGNASGIDRERGILGIKPSGVDYAGLRPADIVLVDLGGKVVEGRLRPSTDTPTHVELYRAFPAIGGIVHTHSPHATAFAQAGRAIPALGTTHADFFDGPVPVTRTLRASELKGTYERDTARAVTELLAALKADPLHLPAALVRHHAPFVWGVSLDKAVENAVALEFCARCAWLTLALEPRAKPLPEGLRRRHFYRKHGAAAYYGQPL
ncbi:MAG TPA: L-ribulose-5-phosphate 4-epimerase AraD [Opitutaceae bacterium]|jgi:L-ribulose-5-phosphate 4-epimerase|nr:L-ribulose-5-phosphate 4-epimerase AraD [Opitutaceae bacterium]